jgi:hypothetical protein
VLSTGETLGLFAHIADKPPETKRILSGWFMDMVTAARGVDLMPQDF